MSAREASPAEVLNRSCDCGVVDLPALQVAVESQLAKEGASAALRESHPHLFSDAPVFVDAAHVMRMERVIDDIDQLVRSASYQDSVLADAPAIARIDRGPSGVFMGFDFHIGRDGPQLIEINTNAGGAYLNVAARAAHRTCCDAADDFIATQPTEAQLEQRILDMFESEWRVARGDKVLGSIAIVDENPREQFLYPEFLLARRLFESRGIRTLVVDPAQLRVEVDGLYFESERIDLVYNRLTDFYIEAPRNLALRQAYENDLAVITPHPRAHALLADKRNLAIFSDPARLEALGAARSMIESLSTSVPTTRPAEGCEETWWRDRKGWFFKPNGGFGSRGAYRGDKLTRRVFAEVMNGDYVAQRLVPPGERSRTTEVGRQDFKVDVRCYAYAGRIQLMAARLYQGQTTNFRTAGGGFAPVYVIGDPAESGTSRGEPFRTTCA